MWRTPGRSGLRLARRAGGRARGRRDRACGVFSTAVVHRRVQGSAGFPHRGRRRNGGLVAERRLHRLFPADGFIGEEGEGRPAREGGAVLGRRSDRRHRQFRARVPHFCVSIAWCNGDQSMVGAIYDPDASTNCSRASAAAGAFLNGAADPRVSDVDRTATGRGRGRLEHALRPRQFLGIRAAGGGCGRGAVCTAARARSRSPMSRPAAATALSNITSTPGTVWPGSCWSWRRAAMSATSSARDGLHKGGPLSPARRACGRARRSAALEGVDV